MTIYQEIGNRIRHARTQARLTQDALATRIGVVANTISRWETGIYRIAIEDVYLLSLELDIPLSAFLPEEAMETTPELNAELKAWDAMVETMRQLKRLKSEQRTAHDRYVAVAITELEKMMAFYNIYVMQERDFLSEV